MKEKLKRALQRKFSAIIFDVDVVLVERDIFQSIRRLEGLNILTKYVIKFNSPQHSAAQTI